MSLVFELAPPVRPAASHRADIACFVGYVARRPGVPLPAAQRAWLDSAGWVNGLWARPAVELERLDNLPVVCDSWDAFDALFAWETRPLDAAGERHCASWLGAAVRAFFAHGGRRALVVRVGDPWPLLEDSARRAALRRQRVRRLLPDFARQGAAALTDPADPSSWQGIQHLYGLPEASMVLLPDLADACAIDTPVPDLRPNPPVPVEGFVECTPEVTQPLDTRLADTPPPTLDASGYAAWRTALDAARAFLHARLGRRDTLLVASLPLPRVDTSRVAADDRLYAQADALGWLQRMGVLDATQDSERPASALVQFAWPWLARRNGGDLPGGLEPPEGALAGLIAGSAVARGCHRSVAGDASMPALRDVVSATPSVHWSLGESGPQAALARRVCLFAAQPDGWALQSDVTAAPFGACRFGGASRLMANLLRACREAGDGVVFEPNGERTWAQLRAALTDVLLAYWREGAFAGGSPSQAFDLRCDTSTMGRNDLDNGRLIVHLSVWPAMSIERINVVLELVDGSDGLRVAA